MTPAEHKLLDSCLDLTSRLPEMDEHEFQQWAELLEQRTGTRVASTRKSFLITSLKLRMRELGFENYRAYYDYLHSGRTGAVEWATLVDRLTVHETRFFRHERSLALVGEYFLPRFLQAHEPPASLQAWSVGCSTGDEPYSLAMVLDQYLAAHGPGYFFGVTASDISLPSIALGRRGIYHKSKLKNVAAHLLDGYFTRQDDDHYQVKEALRKRVCFNQLNVMQMDDAPIGPMDIIMCQNLLIYFDRELREEILATLTRYLAPGGVLILGVGEAVGWRHPALRRIDFDSTLAYQRIERPA